MAMTADKRLRSRNERLLQTALLELGGLLMVAPLYVLIMGATPGESLILIAAITLVICIWSPCHNLVWDRVELARTGRVASDRPQSLRLVHALSHEASSVLVSVPVILALTELSLLQAVLVDFGLSLFYTVWVFVFHQIWDRVSPIRA